MNDFYAGRISIVALASVAAFLLTVSPESSPAQRGGPGATAAGRRIDTLNRQSEQYERDHPGRERGGSKNDSRDRQLAQELTEKIKRDLEGLQSGYNKIVLAMASKERLDLESVLDSVAEVKKCAARLRTNLALPREKDKEPNKEQSATSTAQVKESLLMLRKHIYSFVTNPMFDGPTVLNVEQAGKAGRDLDIILELSEDIRKNGGKPKSQ